MDDDHLGPEVFAEREDQRRTESREPVLVRQNQAAHLGGADPANELPQALLGIVPSRAKILQHLVRPAVGGGERFQQGGLAGEVLLLVVAEDARVEQRGASRWGPVWYQTTELVRI